jgi:hypothetical protein
MTKAGRPTNTVVESKVSAKNGFDVQIQIVDQLFQLTYDKKIAQIRHDRTILNQAFKYIRTSWPTEASAKKAVAKYSKFYNTNKFGYIEIDMFGDPVTGITKWPRQNK